MKIILAKTAGFCMGVRRAVELALEAPNRLATPIHTYGPLIHNPQVLELLAQKGISVIEEIPAQGSGTVLIRAHGVPPQAKKDLKAAGFKVVDATCPRVIRVQSIIRKHARQGYAAIIVGDRDHPEVVGLLGYANDRGVVVGSMEELAGLQTYDKAIIVAQTTQNVPFFEEIQAWAARNQPHYKIFNTICDSTEKRQAEVEHIATDAEAVVVVGGKNSGNTQRLAAIAATTGKPTFHIETEAEIDRRALGRVDSIGLTAGASTPNWVIGKVSRTLNALPDTKIKTWRGRFFSLQRTLLLTNLYVSLGAGLLCYTCMRLMGVADSFPYIFMSTLYVLSMHILNHLTGREADKYNDPERADFYQRHRLPLIGLAAVAGAAGLITAYGLGPVQLGILLVLSLLGLSYNLSFLPEKLPGAKQPPVKYRRIRDIPGSKTILIALAWGMVTALLPALTALQKFGLQAVLVVIWSTGMVFVRTAFFDILDMQGDRIVGRETVPIIMGEKRAANQLKVALIGLGLILLPAGWMAQLPGLAALLAICPALIYLALWLHGRGVTQPGIRLEFFVESSFILAGILTLLWGFFVPYK